MSMEAAAVLFCFAVLRHCRDSSAPAPGTPARHREQLAKVARGRGRHQEGDGLPGQGVG